MSYSLNNKCWNCTKEKDCLDKRIIQGAIYIIHSINTNQGHLGSGTIDLQCQNFDPKEETKN